MKILIHTFFTQVRFEIKQHVEGYGSYLTLNFQTQLLIQVKLKSRKMLKQTVLT